MKKRITTKDFSDRFVFIMNSLGIKTIGQADKFLNTVMPNMRVHNTRFVYLRNELQRFNQPV